VRLGGVCACGIGPQAHEGGEGAGCGEHGSGECRCGPCLPEAAPGKRARRQPDRDGGHDVGIAAGVHRAEGDRVAQGGGEEWTQCPHAAPRVGEDVAEGRVVGVTGDQHVGSLPVLPAVKADHAGVHGVTPAPAAMWMRRATVYVMAPQLNPVRLNPAGGGVDGWEGRSVRRGRFARTERGWRPAQGSLI
jgi:hypothetical protein